MLLPLGMKLKKRVAKRKERKGCFMAVRGFVAEFIAKNERVGMKKEVESDGFIWCRVCQKEQTSGVERKKTMVEIRIF